MFCHVSVFFYVETHAYLLVDVYDTGNGLYHRQVEVFGEKMANLDWSVRRCENNWQLYIKVVLHWFHKETSQSGQENLLCSIQSDQTGNNVKLLNIWTFLFKSVEWYIYTVHLFLVIVVLSVSWLLTTSEIIANCWLEFRSESGISLSYVC